jgi:aubergine-like protein
VETRPAGTSVTTGEGGTPITLFANYFKIETDDTQRVQDYRVDFEPEVESVKVRRLLVQQLNLFRNQAGDPCFVFDGKSNLKAMTQLDPHSLRTEHLVPANSLPGGGPPEAIKVIFLRGENPVEWGSFEMMRFYNMQMRRNFQHLNWLLIFRDFYDPATRIPMPQFGIDVMLGLTTAINQHDGGILMACDAINKIIRHETVLQVMRTAMSRSGAEGVRREVGGVIVMTSYNNRTYKVDDIDFHKTPESTFERRGRGQVSFLNYYKEQYGITIQDKQQPLLICLPSIRDKRAAEQRGQAATTHLLIPELCVMTGLSESLRTDFNLKKQLTQSTQLPPAERYNQLGQFRQRLVANPDVRRDMQIWNLKFSEGLVQLGGRKLDNESLQMARPQPIPIQNPGDFSKEMRSVPMLDARSWAKWAILFPPRCGEVVEPFLEAFRKVSQPLGLSLSNPRREPLSDDRVPAYLTKLSQLNVTPDVFVVCILPNNNKDRYDAIKKRLCIETPCASQCVLSKTLSKQGQMMSVATKICLQMACKFGSSAWGVPIPAKNTMVIGVDTYHDGARKGESVGAFVASMNDNLTRYYSRVSYHHNRDELSSMMAANLSQALDEYKRQNGGRLPDRVVVYRDGVSDGQITHVFHVELNEIRNALNAAAGTDGKDVKLAYIIVTKRINTKFFLQNLQARRLENPQPGTVVDTVVTRPERLEFYLVAQSVRAGTVAPTNFNIICNEIGWKPRIYQVLSYKLCHMYYNWPGTIRVPAPCQYAHKLAFLTGTSLHREPHQSLCDRLFFL